MNNKKDLRCDECDCKYLGTPALNQLCDRCSNLQQMNKDWGKKLKEFGEEFSDGRVREKELENFIQQQLDDKDNKIKVLVDELIETKEKMGGHIADLNAELDKYWKKKIEEAMPEKKKIEVELPAFELKDFDEFSTLLINKRRQGYNQAIEDIKKNLNK